MTQAPREVFVLVGRGARAIERFRKVATTRASRFPTGSDAGANEERVLEAIPYPISPARPFDSRSVFVGQREGRVMRQRIAQSALPKDSANGGQLLEYCPLVVRETRASS